MQDISELQLLKAFVAKTSCNQLLIDSAMYLLTINLPTLKSVAMSLYDITHSLLVQALSRTYAQSVAGLTQMMAYNNITQDFTLVYITVKECTSTITEVMH